MREIKACEEKILISYYDCHHNSTPATTIHDDVQDQYYYLVLYHQHIREGVLFLQKSKIFDFIVLENKLQVMRNIFTSLEKENIIYQYLDINHGQQGVIEFDQKNKFIFINFLKQNHLPIYPDDIFEF
ncbi:MAG: hypothetical protein M1338_04785, partial [Patescibacteria group bacterium]|nr:hypothetical protein [Patescibacteria group bacterium]